jgi:hypothetical protein
VDARGALMGCRTLVAYEQVTGSYSLLPAHWASAGCRLERTLTAETPFGGGVSDEWTGTLCDRLRRGVSLDVEETVEHERVDALPVTPAPIVRNVSLSRICDEYLDFRAQELLVVVDRDWSVRSYEPFWPGRPTATVEETTGSGLLVSGCRVARASKREHARPDVRERFELARELTADLIAGGILSKQRAGTVLTGWLFQWALADPRIETVVYRGPSDWRAVRSDAFGTNTDTTPRPF